MYFVGDLCKYNSMIPDTHCILCTKAFTAEWVCGRVNCSHCPSVKCSLLPAYLIYSHRKVPIAVTSIHTAGCALSLCHHVRLLHGLLSAPCCLLGEVYLPWLKVIGVFVLYAGLMYDIFPCVWQVVYKNNDIRLELSRLARIGDTKMKIYGEVKFICENVATLDPISFETPEAYISLPKWNTKRMGSISFDFRTTEPNGLILFTHGKPQERKDARSQKNTKVDFFAVELLDGNLYLLLDMGSGTIKVKATQKKANDGEWYHVDIQRDGRSGRVLSFS